MVIFISVNTKHQVLNLFKPSEMYVKNLKELKWWIK